MSILALALLQTLGWAQTPEPAPKPAPASVTPAAPPEGAPAPPAPPVPKAPLVAQSDADYYNNNPVYRLRIAEGGPLWTKSLTQEGFKVYNPFFLRDRICLGDGNRLVMLDPATGNITWEHRFERDLDRFIVDGDTLYFTDHRAGLMGGKTWMHAFSLKDKKERWVKDAWIAANLYLYDGHLYRYTMSAFGNFSLHSFDLEGKEEWIFKSKGMGSLFFFDDLVVTAPPGEKKLIALRRKDGSEAWALKLEEDTWDMAFHGGVFYNCRRSYNALNLPGGTVYVAAIDSRTGKSLWTFQIPAEDGWFPEKVGGIVSDGLTCVLNTNRRLIGLDARTGESRWKVEPEGKQAFLQTKPIMLDGELFAVQTRKDKRSVFQFLDLATGRELRRAEVQDEVVPPATVVGKSLFLCFRHGDLLALPLAEGESAGTN